MFAAGAVRIRSIGEKRRERDQDKETETRCPLGRARATVELRLSASADKSGLSALVPPCERLALFAVGDELCEDDKVKENRAKAAHEPAQVLDDVVTLCALDQDAGHICQVAHNGEYKEGER